MPEVFETRDPPIAVISIKYKLRLILSLNKDKPELLKLLKTLIATSKVYFLH